MLDAKLSLLHEANRKYNGQVLTVSALAKLSTFIRFHILHFSLQWGRTSPGNLRIVSCDEDINVSSTRISKEPLYKNPVFQDIL